MKKDAIENERQIREALSKLSPEELLDCAVSFGVYASGNEHALGELPDELRERMKSAMKKLSVLHKEIVNRDEPDRINCDCPACRAEREAEKAEQAAQEQPGSAPVATS